LHDLAGKRAIKSDLADIEASRVLEDLCLDEAMVCRVARRRLEEAMIAQAS
jgi:hypothetical protein